MGISSDEKKKTIIIGLISVLVIVLFLFLFAEKDRAARKKENIEKMSFKIEEIVPGELLSLDILIPNKDFIGSSHVDALLKEGLGQISKKYRINNASPKIQGFFSEGAYGLTGVTGYYLMVTPR
jgi:glucose uptake protein GlcU